MSVGAATREAMSDPQGQLSSIRLMTAAVVAMWFAACAVWLWLVVSNAIWIEPGYWFYGGPLAMIGKAVQRRYESYGPYSLGGGM